MYVNMYVFFYHILFHGRLLQDIEYSSLYYIVGPVFFLSIPSFLPPFLCVHFSNMTHLLISNSTEEADIF